MANGNPSNPRCSKGEFIVTQLSQWAEQYRAELEKQSSARASQVESLLIAGDYEAIREWLQEWESEDKAPNSLQQRYRETRSELQKERYRQRQQQLYGEVIDKITGKASAQATNQDAGSPPTTDFNR
jgi:hypothetical protein